jgi:hypothetical protein
MNLLDLVLFDAPKPVSTPISSFPVEQSPLRLRTPQLQSQSPRMPATAMQEPPFAVPQFSPPSPTTAAGRGMVDATANREGSDISSLAELLYGRGKEKPQDSDLAALLRRAGHIVDNWGDPPSAVPSMPYRTRTMTPMEGPDTGAVNPNADGAGIGSGYFANLRKPEGTTENADAVNPKTGASGPFQFLRGTWADIMKNAPHLGLTWEGFSKPSKNMPQHENAIRHFTAQNASRFENEFGRKPTQAELYSMHLLGGSGGTKLLKNLDLPVSKVVGSDVIRDNPWMKSFANKSGHWLMRHFDKMLGADEG